MIWIAIISILVLSIFVLLLNHFRPKKVSSFFGGNKPSADIIKYIGTIGAAFLVIGTLYESGKTNQAAFESNNIMRKAQVDNRFIEANNLIGSNDISANVAGIYALHQIAIDASKENVQKGYVPVIKNILCALIRANSVVEKDTAYALKEKVFFQTAIDILLRNEFKYTAGIEEYTNVADSFSIDLRGSFLAGCDLSNINSSGGRINLKSANLENAVLIGANLENANLAEANLRRAILNNSNLNGAQFHKTNISGAQFENADLRNSGLKNAICEYDNYLRLNFKGAKLNNLQLERFRLLSANLEGANLEGANLKQAFITHSNFQNANLVNAQFDSAYILRANFDNTNLKNISFEGTTFSLVLLKNTNLAGANFKNAIFKSDWNSSIHYKEGYTDFSESIMDENTNFERTIFDGKSQEEIKTWCKENLITDRTTGNQGFHKKHFE